MTDTPLTTAAFNRIAEYIENYHDGSKPEGPDKREFFAETLQRYFWAGLHTGHADSTSAETPFASERLAQSVEELENNLRVAANTRHSLNVSSVSIKSSQASSGICMTITRSGKARSVHLLPSLEI